MLCASDSKRYISAALFFPPHFFHALTRDCATKAGVISRLHQRRARLPPRPALSFQPRCQSRSPRWHLSRSLFSPYLSARLLFERQPPSVLISGSSSRCPSYFAGWWGLREGWRDTVDRRTICRKKRGEATWSQLRIGRIPKESGFILRLPLTWRVQHQEDPLLYFQRLRLTPKK